MKTPDKPIRHRRPRPDYEAPAVIFEKQIEAVATTCNYDPPLTKQGGGDGCTGLLFS